jgi:tRNA U38,U39,U40 pseudouridine synthase TruA
MKTRTITQPLADPGLMVAVADAHAASDAAARIAADSAHWASRTDAGVDDAAEVVSCAQRARLLAERSERCDSADEAWGCARQAWAAVSSALEASARVNAAIAEALASA